MNRTTFGLSAAAFVIVGFVLWVAGMPRPAETTISAGLADQLTTNQYWEAAQQQGVAVEAATADSTVAEDWLLSAASETRIPIRVLRAYANAAIVQQIETPECGLGWNILAAVGDIESEHGTHGGARVLDDGEVEGQILGPVLSGGRWAAVPDTDQGMLDGNTEWDRAVGPLQFLPATWEENAVDGNGDGGVDPNNIDDAARTAAAYLCGLGGDLATTRGWTAAIQRYNPDPAYLDSVGEKATAYATAVRS